MVALEPSAIMAAQRSVGAAPCVRAVAELLPFADGSFKAAMAILSLHHFSDKAKGLAEHCRVATKRVVLSFDPVVEHTFWLVSEYLPEITSVDYEAAPRQQVAAALGGGHVQALPVPADCTDGFLCAYWARPEAYLDPSVRAGISAIARLDAAVVRRGIERLRADLATGRWDERHGRLRQLDEADVSYRLVVAG